MDSQADWHNVGKAELLRPNLMKMCSDDILWDLLQVAAMILRLSECELQLFHQMGPDPVRNKQSD